MEILIYQVAIVSIILISGLFGRSIRNNVTLILCLFTIVYIFMFWLAILQFITIIISYTISNSYVDVENQKNKTIYEKQTKTIEKPKNNSNIYYILFLIISAIFFSAYVNLNRNKSVPSEKEKSEDPIEIDKTPIDYKTIYNTKIYTIDSLNEISKEEEIKDNSIVDKVNLDSKIDENYFQQIFNNKNSLELKFVKNISNNTIDYGNLYLEKIDDSEFYFILSVDNYDSRGQIRGKARFINSNLAVFSDNVCKALSFEFINDYQVEIMENECVYHGDEIKFNSIFNK